jgi:futalosine hydrolase
VGGGVNPVLVCAATRDELDAFGLEGAVVVEEGRLWRLPFGGDLGDGGGAGNVFAAVTGAGTPHTLLRLIPLIGRLRPSRLVNTGIAGAYPGSGLEIGDVVIGVSEVFADLGMELPDDAGGGGFRALGAFPFADESLRAPLPLAVPAWAGGIPGLKRGRGATVNSCTGTDATGARRRRLLNADFESMEGAAVALSGLADLAGLPGAEPGTPVIEIRAISNAAARRDMRPENIRRALDALRAFWAAHRARAAEPLR